MQENKATIHLGITQPDKMNKITITFQIIRVIELSENAVEFFVQMMNGKFVK